MWSYNINVTSDNNYNNVTSDNNDIVSFHLNYVRSSQLPDNINK